MRKWLLILYFFFCSDAVAENDRAFFWQVTSGAAASERAVVYLMGSIHFADQSFYPLRAEIEQAFEHSDYLAVELDVNALDTGEYKRIISRKGVYPEGKSIKDAVSDDTWKQLRARLKQLNVPYEAVQQYRPGVLVLTMTAVQVMQMGFDPQLGIDVHFLNKAALSPAKQVIELESLQQQLDLFIDIPDGELLLKESLYSMNEAESMMGDMVTFWKQGDVAAMNKLLFEEALDDYPSFASIYDDLFYGRNRKMAANIETMLKQGQTTGASYFVVVGTGHLVGDEGIVKLLKDKGYTVKRL
mgnify:CR=1 FL=1